VIVFSVSHVAYRVVASLPAVTQIHRERCGSRETVSLHVFKLWRTHRTIGSTCVHVSNLETDQQVLTR